MYLPNDEVFRTDSTGLANITNRATGTDCEAKISPITGKSKYAFKCSPNRERITVYTYCRSCPLLNRKQLKHKPLSNCLTLLRPTCIYSTGVVLLQNSLAHNQVCNLIPRTLPSGPLETLQE